MRGERLLRLAAALGVLVIWAVAVILDARSDAYALPMEVSVMAVIASGAIFGADLIVAIIHAWRGRGDPPRKGGDDA